jgi:hypothetical protein
MEKMKHTRSQGIQRAVAQHQGHEGQEESNEIHIK